MASSTLDHRQDPHYDELDPISGRAPLVLGNASFADITNAVAAPIELKSYKGWWMGFLAAVAGLGLLLISVGYLVWEGTGIWGITVNNNPTVSDVFNTAPAWMYPYMSADLAPGAPAQPMLFGGLGGQVIGASAYVQLDGAWYFEAGGYRSLSPAFLRRVNADYDGRLSGITPYARAAYTWNLPKGDFTVGGFVLSMRRGLAGTNLAGDAVPVAGPTDRFRDVGLDSSYRYVNADHSFTAGALYVHEQQRLDATYADGGADHLHNSLQAFNLKVSYWYRQTYGVTLASFIDNGSNDITLYGNNGSPDTRGESIELNYAPFGQPTSWRQPWVNVRLGLQYTYFTRFSGLVHNIDGAGRNASANNTLYFYVWLAI